MSRHALSCLLTSFLCLPISAADRTPEQQAAIDAIRKAGGQVLEVAQNDPRLDVALHLADGDVTDATITTLAKLGDVYSLNLRGTKVTDAGLKHLSGLKSLVRLHLEKTAVTDAGLQQLSGLEKLEYLNLYGTQVSDAGLKHLEPLTNLKRLYLWQTQVTPDAANAFAKERENLMVNLGLTVAPKPAEEKPAEEKPEPEKK